MKKHKLVYFLNFKVKLNYAIVQVKIMNNQKQSGISCCLMKQITPDRYPLNLASPNNFSLAKEKKLGAV